MVSPVVRAFPSQCGVPSSNTGGDDSDVSCQVGMSQNPVYSVKQAEKVAL